MITNKTNEVKTLVDFATETRYLVDDFKEEYGWYEDKDGFDEDTFIANAQERLEQGSPRDLLFEDNDGNQYIWQPEESKYCPFGDEDGDLMGQVYDYMLRHGGETKSFKWRFKEWLR